MTPFSGNLLILGCGSVCQCALPLILKHINLAPKNITVLDFADNRERIRSSLAEGVRFVHKRITKANLHATLAHYLKPGDILLDLAWEIETESLLAWCHDHAVGFLNTSVEYWNARKLACKDPRTLTLYHRQMEIHDRVRKWKTRGPTAIIDHGANPGLVSHFTKQALLDIGEQIVRKKRGPKALEKALADWDFPQLAYLCGLKAIHISERDTQIASDPKQVNEFVNTWSVAGLIEEGLAPAEIGWGTHEKQLPQGAMTHKRGPKNQICLSSRGTKTWVQSWVPSGPITGMVIRHGEAYSISKYLTVWKGKKPIYRPTVHYAYCPSDATINSLHEIEMRGFSAQDRFRILNDEIVSGADELGCLLMGHTLGAWWIGSVLDIVEARRLSLHQNATTVQVAIAVVAGLVYIINHPALGFCSPDDLDHQEILNIAKPYLGQFLSVPVRWSPLDNVRALRGYNAKPLSKSAEWQFSTFLVP